VAGARDPADGGIGDAVVPTLTEPTTYEEP